MDFNPIDFISVLGHRRLLPIHGTADGHDLPSRRVNANYNTALAAGVPAFLMTFNLLFLNEFPDEEADRAGGRPAGLREL